MSNKTLAKTENGVKGIDKKELADIQKLEKFIDIEQQKRDLLKKYINKNLVEGVDYGVIEIESKKTGKSYKSKPTLFKAGSEKFASLMHLRPTFKRDDDTWEMTGRKSGLFCYLCLLLNSKEEIVGEGRGSCDILEKRTANEAIKLAEKRAQLDAILRTGGLSDFFTQDLEDMPQARFVPKPMMATEKQMIMISTLLPKKGKTKEGIYSAYKIASLKELTINQASNIISRLLSLPDIKVEQKIDPGQNEEVVNPEEVERGIDEMRKEGTS